MNLKGKTILVTGSTDGVGRLVARQLADQGARVFIHGRNSQRGEQVVEHIQTAGHGSAVFLSADLSSLAEVRRLADLVRQDCDRLDLLINNAGIGSGGSNAKRETSQDGYELRFAVNYLAGFLLTRLLLPLIMISRPSRIVNVSSLGQHPIDFDDVMLTRGYTGGCASAMPFVGCQNFLGEWHEAIRDNFRCVARDGRRSAGRSGGRYFQGYCGTH